MVSIISMSKYIHANIFHSIFGGTHYVNNGDWCDRNPCSSNEDKNLKDTHVSFVCSQHVVTIQDWTILWSTRPRITLWGLVTLYDYKFFGSGNYVQLYQ